MGKGYADEKNLQILIALLKKHGIRKIIVSPGATNASFVASIQNDSFFELYSSVDERSAGYIACGLAEESGEPVALSCTGATASRNYPSALTEAYYRKLPILAITSTQPEGRIGHNVPQVIDRRYQFNDIVKMSVQVPVVHDEEDEWACAIKINQAILELTHNGGGPAHINITTTYSQNYETTELPRVQYIERIEEKDELPILDGKKVGIFVGAHSKWSDSLLNAVDEFCEKYNAVVITDHTSNYQGKYGVLATLITGQDRYYTKCRNMDVLIHIGNISGAYIFVYPEEVWRVNPDGKVCDTFNKLRYTFEMEEISFFEKYNAMSSSDRTDSDYAREWKEEYYKILEQMPELPFSNAWIAKNTLPKIQSDAIIHLGILNSLRNWNFFNGDNNILYYTNTGGFGIDGCVSSLIGASLANKDVIHYGVVGDLAFFYDMNSIGNRCVQNNIRLIVINNGEGVEFRNYNHTVASIGEAADEYVAAKGHYGKQSRELLKNYSQNLGFEYMSASNKEEFEKQIERFTDNNITDKPMIFEVFTNADDESEALHRINNIMEPDSSALAGKAKSVLGERNVNRIKKIIKKG